MCARYVLPLLQGGARVHSFNMLLELSFAATLNITEWAIGVLLSDMGLKFLLGDEGEMSGSSI